MKKIFTSLAIALLSLTAWAQENPCPTVSGIRKTNVVFNGDGTCNASITLHITNDVSGSNPKGVRVEVLCGGSQTPVLDQCFLASTAPGGADFTTNTFTCLCSEVLTIRITRYTASNGTCQGGTCGSVLIIQESPLPVSFVSFTAKRNDASVLLSWQTSTEQNSKGFSVERNTNGSTWEEVAFIPSQAAGGNSNDLLTYHFTDANSSKGVTQYRIKQVDIDEHYKFSEIRSVRGWGQAGKIIVYPNPSSDGKVKVVFEEAAAVRDVTLVDMNGRVVRQWRGVTNNNIQIDNLVTGMYTLRVVDTGTGEQTVEKLVVSKR